MNARPFERRTVDAEEATGSSLILARDLAASITGQNINATNGGEVR